MAMAEAAGRAIALPEAGNGEVLSHIPDGKVSGSPEGSQS